MLLENVSSQQCLARMIRAVAPFLLHIYWVPMPVILRKNQGEEVSVMVARDLDFSGVYRLK